MKINLAIDCIEPSAANTIVSLHSFISRNEWFNGKVYIIVANSDFLLNSAISSIISIYKNIEIVDCSLDPNLSNYIKLYSSNPSGLRQILKIKSILLEEKTLYITSGCLFLKNIESILSQNQMTFPMNINGEIIFDVFYVRSPLTFEKLSQAKIQLFIIGKLNLLELISSQLTVASSSILGESSTYFNDSVFLKRRSRLPNLHFIIYDSLKRDSKVTLKINKVWIQHSNQLFNLLKKPSFRTGKSIFSSDPNVNPKIRNIHAKTIQSNSRNILSKDQLEKNTEACTSLSIIIPAYRASNYIEQCLDSIFSQTKGHDVEVLIGVDACSSTLTKINSIKNKYNGLKVYYSDLSIGAYVMRNSLFEKSSNDMILFFDADDVLMPNSISNLLKLNQFSSPVRFKYINFKDNEPLDPAGQINKEVAHGVFFIPRIVFERIGGFQNWQVGADTEFMKRCEANKIMEITLNFPIFFRRIHSNSLTQRSSTGYKSKLRSEIKKKIQTMKNWNIPIPRSTINLTLIE